MQEHVVSLIESDEFVAYAVWEPILRTDDERSSRKAATLFPDERVTHYWIPTQKLAERFQAPIGLTTEPAWDVYLVYEPGIAWDDRGPPKPTYFQHQLRGRLPTDLRLDPLKLHGRIAEVLGQHD